MGQAMKQLHQMANANVIVGKGPPHMINATVAIKLLIRCRFRLASVSIPSCGRRRRYRIFGNGSHQSLPFVNPAIHHCRHSRHNQGRSRGTSLAIFFSQVTTHASALMKIWESQPPKIRQSVSFVAGDFLAPTLEATQLPRGEPTYLIRHVLHDWTDQEVVTILKNVRAAMVSPPLPPISRSQEGDAHIHPSSPVRAHTPRLLLCEMLLREDSGRFAYTTSIQVLALNNGIIRTEKEMHALLAQAGFRVVTTHTMRAVDTIIEAVPASV